MSLHNMGRDRLITAMCLREAANHFEINSNGDPLKKKIAELIRIESKLLSNLALHELRTLPTPDADSDSK